MADWQEAPDLRDLALNIIARKNDVAHVDPNEVLFLWESETKPKAKGFDVMARTYGFKDEPIGFFTAHRFGIVFYRQQMDWMSPKQRAILMWHELKHIPLLGDKLKPHDVNDFYAVLKAAGINWGDPDGEVPDILE